MNQTTTNRIKSLDPVELSKTMANVAERSQAIVRDFVTHQENGAGIGVSVANVIGKAFLGFVAEMAKNPGRLLDAQISLWRESMAIWQNTSQRMLGMEAEAVAVPEKGDKRFKDEEWQKNPLFDFVKQSYLLVAQKIQSTACSVEGVNDRTAKKIEFLSRQFVDALAPSNFMMTNPEVWRTTVETNGDNLVNGLRNLLEDLERGQGRLDIKMTDMDAFKLGENIATTAGKVVYRNDMMELIQYEPTTEKVHKRPLLILSPWINISRDRPVSCSACRAISQASSTRPRRINMDTGPMPRRLRTPTSG